MVLKEQSILDDYSYAPPIVVAESIRNTGETIPAAQTTPQVQQEQHQVYNDQQSIADGPRIDITQQVPEDQKHLVGPAGIGGAVVGFLFGGPILSAFLGFGSAYAVRKENGAGDAARALGEMTMSVQQKAAEIEDRHRYYGRSVEAINRQCEKSHKSCAFKTREFVRSSWRAVEVYTRKHQLVERGVEGTGKSVEYVAGVFKSTKTGKTGNDDQQEKSDLRFQEEKRVSDNGSKYTKVASSEQNE